MDTSSQPKLPSLREALQFWCKLGLISFGGPAGQIAIMHRELVEVKKWMDERHFMHGLNFCMLLPGPEAQQLATYLGWRLHGMWGGVAAGALFVLPSALLLFALSWLFMVGDALPWVGAVFHGLLGAVMAIVLDAVLRIGSKSLRTVTLVLIAGAAFVAIYFFSVSFVFIILAAAGVGSLGHRLCPAQFPVPRSHASAAEASDRLSHGVSVLPPVPRATWRRTAKVLAVTLVLWWVPVLILGSWLGWDSTSAQQGLFFSKAALVTFGGAYAVLPYVAQQAVENYQWLSDTQMMSGLALAESTPGPLIMVLQFVGFVGGWQHSDFSQPWMGALLGSAITTWVTFLPCFLFVFLGAPWIEKIGNFPRMAAALAGITACVVGVILNLAVRFSQAAMWPGDGFFDWFVVGVAVASFLALRLVKWPVLSVIGAAALAGLLWSFLPT